MRAIEEINLVLSLVEDGLNDCEIARRTGIPRGTVRDWRRGKLPRRNGWNGGRGQRARSSCVACGHQEHDFGALPEGPYAYLLGLYLGDGCISKGRKRVFRLRITLDQRYPGILNECSAAMEGVSPTSKTGRVRRTGCIEVYSYSRAWPCLIPQHGPGVKHERRIILEPWQEDIASSAPHQLIRGLIHSDGCRAINRVTVNGKRYSYPRYFFCNTSADIRDIFCRYCDLIGVAWRQDGPKNISVARRHSVALLDTFVGPKQ